MKNIFLFILCLSYISISAQTDTVSIKGIVVDKKTKEPIPFANITLLDGGSQVKGTTTDFDGKFYFKLIEKKKYDLNISYVGFKTQKISLKKFDDLIISLEEGIKISCGGCFFYLIPLYEKDNNTIERIYTRSEINRLASF